MTTYHDAGFCLAQISFFFGTTERVLDKDYRKLKEAEANGMRPPPPDPATITLSGVVAMKIMDTFGVGGSFTEYYAMDYRDDIVLMGHDGPGHLAIAEGKTKVRPLDVYHGKVGRGLSVEMSVKHGPVTLLSVVQTADGKLKLLTAEGESVPGPILEIGNTNSRYRFPGGARRFVTEWSRHGPAHHCAVGVGRVSSRITKLGDLLGMECIQVQ